MIKMKAVLVLLALVSAIVAVQADLCTSHYCEKVTCDSSITLASCTSSGGEYRPNGSMCGCCPFCVAILGEGERCYNMRRAPAPGECRPPLKCVDKVCTKTN